MSSDADSQGKSLGDVHEWIDAFFYPDPLAAVKHLEAKGRDINSQNGYVNTVLIESIKRNAPDVTLYLLDRGANPNIWFQSLTPLSAAAEEDEAPPYVLSALLAHGAKAEHDPALHCAASRLSIDKVNLLLKHGMNPNDTLTITPYKHWQKPDYFDRKTPLHDAVDHRGWPEKQVPTIKALLAGGADTRMRNEQGELPIDVAARKGLKDVVELLKQNGSPEPGQGSQS